MGCFLKLIIIIIIIIFTWWFSFGFLCRVMDVFLDVLEELAASSFGATDLVQVNADLVRKNGLCRLSGNVGRNLTNQSYGRWEECV